MTGARSLFNDGAVGLPGRVKSFRPGVTTIALAAAVIACIVIVSNAWVLTNYGLDMMYLGIDHSPLISPLQADGSRRLGAEVERTITTPLYQIVVNNGFQRFNQTSPYLEDLRSLRSLPLADWYILFKPDNAAFFVLPPAMAYSFHQLFLILAFVGGYTLLMRKFGVGWAAAVFIAIAFYYSSLLQFWWTFYVPPVAYFPWLVLAATMRNHIAAGLATFYAAAVWIPSYLYPPIMIPLALSGGVCVLLLTPLRRWLVRLPILVFAAGAAAAMAYFYLHDVINVMQTTAYPGQRVSKSGEGASILMWWSQFVPTAFLHEGRRIGTIEPGEAAGAGSILFLALPFLVDWRHFFAPEQAALRRKLVLPLILLAMMWIWIVVPGPPWWGRPFLFTMVTSRRMVFGAGALLMIIAAIMIGGGRFRFTWPRVAAICALVAVSWVSTSYLVGGAYFSRSALLDAALIPVAIAAALVARFAWPRAGITTLAGGAALVSMISFGGFYGVQSARPIFERGEFGAKAGLDAMQEATPGNLITIAGERLNGGILNGVGYRSVAHAFLVPRPDFLRRFYPDMDDERFNYLFNRMSVVRLVPQDEPESPGLGVWIPIFDVPSPGLRRLVLDGPPNEEPTTPRDGFYLIRRAGDHYLLEGWGRFRNVSTDQAVYLQTDAEIVSAEIAHNATSGDGDTSMGGFVIKLETPEGVDLDQFAGGSLSLWSSDPETGLRRLEGPDVLP